MAESRRTIGGGCFRPRAEGQILSIPALSWDRDVRLTAESAALKLNETAVRTGPNPVTLLTGSVAQRLGPAGVFMARCCRFLHVSARGSCPPSARAESVYSRFLWARCDRLYRHIWQWYFHAGGMRLPQRRLSLLFYFKLLFDSELHWGAELFSFFSGWPRKPNSSCPASLCPPQQGRLHTVICFWGWRMCSLCVCSHPEPTINGSFVQQVLHCRPSIQVQTELTLTGRGADIETEMC